MEDHLIRAARNELRQREERHRRLREKQLLEKTTPNIMQLTDGKNKQLREYYA